MHVERSRNLRLVWDTGEKFMSYMWVYSGLEIIYYKEKVSKKKLKEVIPMILISLAFFIVCHLLLLMVNIINILEITGSINRVNLRNYGVNYL